MEIQDVRYSLGLYKKMVFPHMCGCPLCIHNTKKACFIRLRGCPYAPYIWMLSYVWMSPVCLDAAICLNDPLYIWMPPYAFLYVWTPPYVWMPPVCLDTPIGLDASHMFG